MVRFHDNTRAADRVAGRAAVDGEIQFAIGDYQVLEVDDASAAVAELRRDSDVVRAFADPPVRALTTTTRPKPPNDPRFGEQWAMLNTGQYLGYGMTPTIAGADVRALEAWQWTQGEGAPPLAVIDSGVDTSHPDLAGAAWTNPREIPANGADDNGNGFVDDVQGWDFIEDRPANGTDPYSHGTGVAGVAVARANNRIGVAGVAPRAKVMPLVVTDPDGYGHGSDVAHALLYAGRNGARVANVSLGLPNAYSGEILTAAIREVPDLLVVAAAGNDAADNDTATYAMRPCVLPEPNVVCVAATDPSDELARFSNSGATTVDLAAPGEDMLIAVSTNPGRDRLPTYGWTGGTSLSAPLVAGAAQLLLAKRPDLTFTTLREALLASGRERSALVSRTVTGRRLDIAAALQRVAGAAPTTAAQMPKPRPPQPLPAAPAPTAVVSVPVAPSGDSAAPALAAAPPTVAARRQFEKAVSKPRKAAKRKKTTKRKTRATKKRRSAARTTTERKRAARRRR